MSRPIANPLQLFGFWLRRTMEHGTAASGIGLVLLLLTVAGAGCKTNPVGRQCFIPGTGQDGGIPLEVVGSPALECQSRTCLHIASHEPDLCTAECEVDGDCDTSPESPCKDGFVCMVPVYTGDFCCKKLCVCKDYVTGTDITTEPAACDPANALNECCNLAGRRENPTKYPACKSTGP